MLSDKSYICKWNCITGMKIIFLPYVIVELEHFNDDPDVLGRCIGFSD